MIPQHFYNKDLRKAVIAFGALFNNITLIKYDRNGTEIKRTKVPLSYASKEKYLVRLQQDATNARSIGFELPRMAFEMVGIGYDPSRKQQTMEKMAAVNQLTNASMYSNFVPVPYNVDFNLHIFSREIDDGLQILEQIIPYFTPDYTVTIKFNDIIGKKATKDTPIILNGYSFQDTSDGPIEDVRLLVWTVSFTMKTYLYGPTKSQAQILHIVINYYDATTDRKLLHVDGSIVYANVTRKSNVAILSANVMSQVSANDILQINNDVLRVLNVTSNSVTTNHTFTSSLVDQYVTKLVSSNNKLVMYTADVNPNTALSTDNYTIDEVFTEY
jgi:hypothetical protein